MHPVLRIGDIGLPTYGLLAAAGWFLAIYYWIRQVRHMGLRKGEGELWTLIYVVVAGAIVGGKLLALVAYIGHSDLWSLLLSFRAGFVYLGGVIGAGFAGFLFCKLKGYGFLATADFFAPGLALGHAIGRLGCFGAGCCHGSPTSLPWGVTFTDPLAAVLPHLRGVPLHPSQIYEVIGELAIFLILHFYFVKRRIAKTLAAGLVSMAYLAMYGVLRFGLDFVRGDDPDFRLGPITASQGLSLVLIVAALVYGNMLRTGKAHSPTPTA